MTSRCPSLQHSSSSATEHVVSAGEQPTHEYTHHTNICPALPHELVEQCIHCNLNQLPDGNLPPTENRFRAAGSCKYEQGRKRAYGIRWANIVLYRFTSVIGEFTALFQSSPLPPNCDGNIYISLANENYSS